MVLYEFHYTLKFVTFIKVIALLMPVCLWAFFSYDIKNSFFKWIGRLLSVVLELVLVVSLIILPILGYLDAREKYSEGDLIIVEGEIHSFQRLLD